MVDDIDIIIVVVSDTVEDILQCNEAKQETMYDRIEAELKGVQQALYLNRTMSTMPLSAGDAKVGDEPAQLCILVDSTKDHLRQVQEEKEVRLRNKKKMTSKRSLQRIEHRSKRRNNNCSQRRWESRRQSPEHFALFRASHRYKKTLVESQAGKLVEDIQQLQE
jgi:hypothetical protein